MRGLAACGVLGALVLAAAVTAGAGPRALTAPAEFRLQDGSAGCGLLESGELACRAAGAKAGAALSADGASKPSTVAVEWTEATPVLLPAESWWQGAFVCRAEDGIVCSAGDGSIEVGAGGAGGIR